MKSNPDWLTHTPFAHRGLHAGRECPENSLAAFAAACEQGFPIELDVQVIADGEVIVFHDADLERMTGIQQRIEDVTLPELETLRLLGSDQPIPTLRQVLQQVASKVPLLVEIKHGNRKGSIEPNVWRVLSQYPGAFAILSSNPASLSWFRTHAPHVIRGQVSADFEAGSLGFIQTFTRRLLLLDWRTCPDFIAHDLCGLPHWTAAFWKRRIPLLAWTVRTDEDKRKARAYADNYIFEIPAD